LVETDGLLAAEVADLLGQLANLLALAAHKLLELLLSRMSFFERSFEEAHAGH
jgi:hypothetical protein